MKAIVINADDFGYSDGISAGIVSLISKNYVTSTSAMVASPTAETHIARHMSDSLRGRVGLHLQLTGGEPLSSRREAPDLHSDDGCFRDPRTAGAPPVAQVEIEWRRQVDRFTSLFGCKPSHLDSHHGMHRRSGYFELYLRLAKELRVPVRGPLESHQLARMADEGVSGSNVLVRDWTGHSLDECRLVELVGAAVSTSLPSDVIEVICHPGRVDPELRSKSSMTDTRQVELDALMGLGRSSALADIGVFVSHQRIA